MWHRWFTYYSWSNRLQPWHSLVIESILSFTNVRVLNLFSLNPFMSDLGYQPTTSGFPQLLLLLFYPTKSCISRFIASETLTLFVPFCIVFLGLIIWELDNPDNYSLCWLLEVEHLRSHVLKSSSQSSLSNLALKLKLAPATLLASPYRTISGSLGTPVGKTVTLDILSSFPMVLLNNSHPLIWLTIPVKTPGFYARIEDDSSQGGGV